MIDRYFKHQENSNLPFTNMQMVWQGFGIMIDDIAAAFATLFIVLIAHIIGVQLGWA